MRPVDADEAKRIAREYLTDPYHVISAVAVLDKTPTLTQPNEPLTLEQLREMDGEPVWFETIKRWGIVKVCQDGTFILTKSGEFEVGYITRRKYYRRPPERQEDT